MDSKESQVTDHIPADTGDPTFTEIDYIANLLYQTHARNEGYVTGVRWWCHCDEGRVEWRQEARDAYRRWAAEEAAILKQQKARYP